MIKLQTHHKERSQEQAQSRKHQTMHSPMKDQAKPWKTTQCSSII